MYVPVLKLSTKCVLTKICVHHSNKPNKFLLNFLLQYIASLHTHFDIPLVELSLPGMCSSQLFKIINSANDMSAFIYK